MKKKILKLIIQIIYKYSEHTPSNIKYSERNKIIGNITLSIQELIKTLK